jgi:VCBS repeat protein
MAAPANRRLDSWKEIADYLDRDVRTVIRWEKEKSLPVHRVPGGKRQGVFAFSEEIDQWMLGQGAGLEAENKPGADADLQGAPGSSRLAWLRFAYFFAALFVLFLAAAWLWMERGTSSAAGPPPLLRPLQFARSDYQAGTPRGLIVGDFNGDRLMDLAFTDSMTGKVVVLLGDGHGTFAQRVSSSTTSKAPEHLVAGDFNGDGKLDIAVTSYFGGAEIEVLLGNGNGSFRPHYHYDAGGRSRWIAAGDLNRDGKLDLVVAGSTASRIIVLLGKGDGTFQEGGRFEAERDVAALALADLNSDGALDIVAADYRASQGQSVSVYWNSGDGKSFTRERFPTGSGPLGLAVADLNNDGKLDVVTANFPLNASILFGGSAMKFAEPQELDAGRGNGFVEVADLDRDGALDLLILGEHSNTATVLLGDGRGGFRRVQDVPTGDYPDAVVVADFDGDRKPDLAILNIDGNSISVFLNRTDEAVVRRWLSRLNPFRSN